MNAISKKDKALLVVSVILLITAGIILYPDAQNNPSVQDWFLLLCMEATLQELFVIFKRQRT